LTQVAREQLKETSMTKSTNPELLEQRALKHLLLHFSRNGAYGPGGARLPVIVRGEGPYVWDADGNRYFDAMSGLISSQLGYSFGDEMGAAGAEQLRELFFVPTWAQAHEPAIELAARLAELAPGDLNQAFFTSGGGDSNESAWKIARQYHLFNGEPQRTKAITRKVAYHGATLGALALTGVEPYREPFAPAAIDVRHVSNTLRFRAADGDDEEALCARLLTEVEDCLLAEGPETISLILAEPVQTAGGCITPPDGYWAGLREIADRHGILLAADEVVTGFGRLGHWLGGDRFGIVPDLITAAKGMTSSYAPMGAVLVSDRVADAFRADAKRTLLHGLTFGGHPLSCAIALKNLEILEREGVAGNVLEFEPLLRQRLGELLAFPGVGDVRGAGFMWAIEFARPDGGTLTDGERERLLREFLPERLRVAGIVTRTDDRGGHPVMFVAPPLICDADQLDELLGGIAEVIADSDRFISRLTAN
jgi:adenosylmethionine-8-amino-7-oxononanoate aminotransferase